MLLAFIQTACQHDSSPKNTTVAAPTSAADNTSPDEHGCSRKDGFQWSVIRNECISTFEVGIHLQPVDSFMEKHLFAFVVFTSEEDDSQAELFIPKQEKSIVLTKIGEDKGSTWKQDNMTLKLSDGKYSLIDGETVLYAGEAASH